MVLAQVRLGGAHAGAGEALGCEELAAPLCEAHVREGIESLVDPVALALNEVVSVCTARDIEEEFKSPELALDGVGHHLSVTLRLLLESKKPDFRLDTHIRRCANSKQSAQQFNAL